MFPCFIFQHTSIVLLACYIVGRMLSTGRLYGWVVLQDNKVNAEGNNLILEYKGLSQELYWK